MTMDFNKPRPGAFAEIKVGDDIEFSFKEGKAGYVLESPIKSKTVEMSAMTMTFPVRKPALMTKVKVGDKVRFTVENVSDAATVTALVVQK